MDKLIDEDKLWFEEKEKTQASAKADAENGAEVVLFLERFESPQDPERKAWVAMETSGLDVLLAFVRCRDGRLLVGVVSRSKDEGNCGGGHDHAEYALTPAQTQKLREYLNQQA